MTGYPTTTRRERAAFNAGVEAVRQMALTTAVSIEVRDDASRLLFQEGTDPAALKRNPRSRPSETLRPPPAS
jgi:hypothetical protein